MIQKLSIKSTKNQTSSTVYNIGTANSSVFGNHNNFSISYNESLSNLKNEVQNSDSTDKEELQEIVQLLEMIVNNKVPASKGIFFLNFPRLWSVIRG